MKFLHRIFLVLDKITFTKSPLAYGPPLPYVKKDKKFMTD